MTLRWDLLSPTKTTLIKERDPTIADANYDYGVIWVNKPTNSAWLLKDGTIQVLPPTTGTVIDIASAGTTTIAELGASLSNLQQELDDLEDQVGPDPETVEKTISGGGAITVIEGEKHILLIGDGGAADTLTDITGGTAMDEITLWRKADLGYSIIIGSDAGLHLQRNRSLTLNANYDNVTLVCKEPDVWIEKGGRISAD